jgi:hypothetical protein
MFAGGVAAVVGGAVLAARATLKAEPVIDKLHYDLTQVQGMRDTSVSLRTRYASNEYKRDLFDVGGRGAKDLVKLYGPALIVGGGGIALLTASHFALVRRNKALAVTLTALSQAYAGYRNRVRDVVGRDRELEIYQNSRIVEVETEDGRIETTTEVDPTAFSIYAKLFDETTSTLWSKGYGVNNMAVSGVQAHFNQRLAARGHVFLNEVYDALGLERTTAGQLVGWIWQSDGDNYIDFGLHTPRNMDFLDGFEKSAWLDFNVDGEIFEQFA